MKRLFGTVAIVAIPLFVIEHLMSGHPTDKDILLSVAAFLASVGAYFLFVRSDNSDKVN